MTDKKPTDEEKAAAKAEADVIANEKKLAHLKEELITAQSKVNELQSEIDTIEGKVNAAADAAMTEDERNESARAAVKAGAAALRGDAAAL